MKIEHNGQVMTGTLQDGYWTFLIQTDGADDVKLIPDADCNGKTEFTEVQLEYGTKRTSFEAPNVTTGNVTGLFKNLDDLLSEVADPETGLKSRVFQLGGAWAIQNLNDRGDIISQMNLIEDMARIQARFIHLSGTSLIDNAVIKSAHIDTLNANKITGNTADFNVIRTGVLIAGVITSTHIKAENALIDNIFGTAALIERLTSKTAFINNIKAISIDVDKITGNTANFISAGFHSLNSQATINGHAIRIQNATGEFVEMNNSPEIRSDDSGGTTVVLGKGRVHFYDKRGISKGYVGTDMHTQDSNDFGTYLSRGGGSYRFARMADATQATYATYTVKAGMTDRVSIIEDMVRKNLLPDGNASQFIAKSNMIAQMNGWPILPGAWPTQYAGNKVKYKELSAEVVGEAYQDLWRIGVSTTNEWRTYFVQPVTFAKGYVDNSDRRLKYDIANSEIEALRHIESLTLKSFKWKDDNRYEPIGLIAQDSGILRVNNDEYEGINTLRAVMLSLKGVKELHEIVKGQAEEIRQLKEINNQ